MNIVRTPRLVARTLFLVPLLATGLILSACGGGDNNNTSASSSSSSANSHSLIPTDVTPTGSGTWPEIEVTADHNKQLNFRWLPGPAGTSFYRLLKNTDVSNSDNAYTVIEDNITNLVAGSYSTSVQISVHIEDWVNSRYKVQACSDVNTCSDSTEIITNSAMLSAITYIKADNADANDWFGWSIALSGDGKTLAVGAPAEDSKANVISQAGDSDNSSPNSGAVYVFIKNTEGNWVQQAYVKASNTEPDNTVDSKLSLPNDRFGYQIALSPDGDTLAVSAIQEDSRSQGINCDQNDLPYTYSSSSSTATAHHSYNVGAVYIFKRSADQWAQTTYIKPHNPTKEGLFGTSLSLSGDGKLLAVGTYLEGTSAAGIYDARSFSSSSCINFSTWSESSSSSSLSSSSSFSSSSVSSSSIMGGQESGAVYLFKETDAGWIEETFIKASDAGALDHFGISVSLSHDGTALAVGAPGEDSQDSGPTDNTVTVNGTNIILNNGGVYLFAHANDAWTQEAKVKPFNNGFSQQFGYSVALSGDGNTLAVGAPGDWTISSGVEAIVPGTTGKHDNYDLTATPNTYSTGAAYVFVKTAQTWTATTYLKASNPQAGYQFGSSLSLSGDGKTLAVGSAEEASGITGINGDQVDRSAPASGAVYVFQQQANSTWQQKSYVKAPDTASNDRFANALKLDNLGDILAVGAHRESSPATGINGDQSNSLLTPATGAVYLF